MVSVSLKKMAEGEQSTTKSTTPITNPPIMRVEAPPDESVSKGVGQGDQGNCDTKSTGEFKMCSPTFRASASSFNSNPFATSQNKTVSRGILKPPQLSLNNSSSASFVLNPSKLNPFAKSSTDGNEKTPFMLNPSRLNPVISEPPKSSGSKDDSLDNKQTVQNGETLKFVPLIHPDKPNTVATSSTNSSMPCSSITSNNSFVFGQNLQERVIAETKPEEPTASTSLNSNGTSEMLFSSAIKHEIKSDSALSNKETKSLSESAREYEESRAVKRKYEEVEVRTGEEEETNILSVSCKLFAFDKISGSWQERGRGILRLNDFEVGDHIQSRLVFRTSGSLRVILNTKIWAEMTIEKASDKSIRLTALDANGDIRVFLIMASIEDNKQLFGQLQSRLDKEIASQKRKRISQDAKETESMAN